MTARGDGKDVLYYTASLINNKAASVPCVFNQTLPVPVIERATDYYMFVENINLDLSQLPSFLFKDNREEAYMPDGTTPNPDYKSYYVVAMSFVGTNAVTYRQYEYVRYVPQQVSPSSVVIFGRLRPVYTYWQMLHEVNRAVATCLVNLKAQAPPGLPADLQPPYFSFDSDTRLFSCTFEDRWSEDYYVANPMAGERPLFYNNTVLFLTMDNYDTIFRGRQAATENDPSTPVPTPAVPGQDSLFGTDFIFRVYNQYYNRTTTSFYSGFAARPAFKMTQDAPSVNMIDLDRIIIATTLPVARTFYNIASSGTTSAANAPRRPPYFIESEGAIPTSDNVIADFPVYESLSIKDIYQRPSIITYSPSVRQYFELNSGTDLIDMNYLVKGQNKSGYIYTARIPQYSTATIRFGFVKKELVTL